jgi:transcriptional regulator with XRE-family HTH domain
MVILAANATFVKVAASLQRQFGERVRRLREQRNLSQEEVASKARLNPAQISLLESGHRQPRLQTIVALAHGLGIDPGELVAGLKIQRTER